MNTKTTIWAAVAATALAFILFVPAEMVQPVPVVGPWILYLAKFAAVGGLAKFGIEAADKKQ